jgi:hypothetical protein
MSLSTSSYQGVYILFADIVQFSSSRTMDEMKKSIRTFHVVIEQALRDVAGRYLSVM